MRPLSLVILFCLCSWAAVAPAPPRPCEARRAARPPLNLKHSTSFVVYPQDTNHLGTLFGGKTLAEMDRAAGVCVRRLLYASPAKRAVTSAADSVRFLRPARVGDLLFVSAEVSSLGEKFINVDVVVEREGDGGGRLKLAEAGFTFVAVDEAGKPVAHGLRLER